MVEVVGSILEISRTGDAADFEWRIRGSETYRLERGRWLQCPPLSFGGWTWRLEFGRHYPSTSSCPLALRLCRFGSPSHSPLNRYCLRAVKVDGELEEEEIGRGWMEPASYVAEHPWLMFPDLRRRMRCSAPSSGTLTFFLSIRTGPETDDEMKSLEEREAPASSREVSAEKFTQTDIEDTLLLKEHLRKFLSSDDRNVLLRVKDKEFQAHKSFLRARSPVFEAMFSHAMRENEEDSVTIEDVDPDCFGAFLAYIYTGEVEDLSPANALGLYYAGDKYDFPSLKRRCVDVLKVSLSTTLVCDVITLAATHGEEELLESAMAYFTEHQDEVMETVEWQRFTLSNPIRASEVCLAAVKRYRASRN